MHSEIAAVPAERLVTGAGAAGGRCRRCGRGIGPGDDPQGRQAVLRADRLGPLLGAHAG